MTTSPAASKFVVIETSAKMPAKVKSAYKHCAVMEMAADADAPKMISARAKGCIRIVWESVNYPAAGKTERSERVASLTYAREEAARLNAATVA